MKKEWFFDRFCGEQLAVYAEDGKIIEMSVESERHGDVVGNIYKGRVANVVPGMQAAFVFCGMERNCYLPFNEGDSLVSKYDGAGNVNRELSLRAGDEILVQVSKVPRGSKGAKVTCDISFVGKNLIYLPQTDFIGISRKIVDEALREELLKEADKLRKAGEGIIVRTVGANATKRQLKTELEYLRRLYRLASETATTAKVGAAVYREYDLPMKVMRDSLGDDVNKIYVGNGDLYEKILSLARMRADIGEKKIVKYEGEKSLFASYYQLDRQIHELASMRVPLENGANLVIDRTEAMTVFDVNTGKFTGDMDLESTAFETNILAAREIARQVRLRNIGGIVTVDFIDVTEEAHRKAVESELCEALAKDREKCRAFPMNELCVMLFTRRRTNGDISSFLLQPCSHCTRQGFVLSDIYLAMRVRNGIMETFAEGYRSALVHLSASRLSGVLAGRYFTEEFAGVWKNKRVYLIPHTEFQEERIEVRGDNSAILTLPSNAQILY